MTYYTNFKTSVKKLFTYTPLHILVLLSLIIILILIYIKKNNIELFNSFINNYIASQKFNNEIQSTMITQSKKINDFGEDIQKVLQGGIVYTTTTRGPTTTLSS